MDRKYPFGNACWPRGPSTSFSICSSSERVTQELGVCVPLCLGDNLSPDTSGNWKRIGVINPSSIWAQLDSRCGSGELGWMGRSQRGELKQVVQFLALCKKVWSVQWLRSSSPLPVKQSSDWKFPGLPMYLIHLGLVSDFTNPRGVSQHFFAFSLKETGKWDFLPPLPCTPFTSPSRTWPWLLRLCSAFYKWHNHSEHN